eukprot:TRINITY_DN38102_c0_g1_i1.p1 TRINITY_DN38102_c0_g1~~TRINITY_DN38102_c0_g1_i1.p1  ORF type:complete len:559 (-),score=65.49 TRINITY_DN38102_c0_g1_i1:95-1771(-)
MSRIGLISYDGAFDFGDGGQWRREGLKVGGRGRLALALLLVNVDVTLGKSLFTLLDDVTPGKVYEFTPSEFKQKIYSDKDFWIVDYYAHWCPHCIRFVPVWIDIAKHFSSTPRVHLGALNCADHQDFCREIQIPHYPSLRAYHIPGKIGKSYERRGADVKKGSREVMIQYIEEKLRLAGNRSASSTSPGPSPVPTRLSIEKSSSAKKFPVERLTKSNWSAAVEDRIYDAELALFVSLLQGTFLGAEAVSDSQDNSTRNHMIIRGRLLSDLLDWLGLLGTSLPTATSRADIQSVHRQVLAFVSRYGGLRSQEWYALLERTTLDGISFEAARSPEKRWRSCLHYTCGLWTLFHVLTLAQTQKAMHSPLVVAGVSLTKSLPPRIRSFVANFFGCVDCVRNFLQLYDSCAHGRCAQHTAADLVNGSSHGQRGDGVTAALWLWRAHNNVTARIASYSSGAIPVGTSSDWPSAQECGRCRLPSGSWDETEVLYHLKRSYWPKSNSSEEGVIDETEPHERVVGDTNLLRWALHCVCGAVLLFLTFALHGRRRSWVITTCRRKRHK